MSKKHSYRKKIIDSLSAPRILGWVREVFSNIPDVRNSDSIVISLVDALMSGLAVFGLKYPSLLQFDEHKSEPVIRHNLKTLYGVEYAPCDTQMRTILDPVEPYHLDKAFVELHQKAAQEGAFQEYEYMGGYHLISIDGTGHYCSGSVDCPQCCVKKKKNGTEEFYHQLLGAVVVHPDKKTVIPLAPEAITKEDGQEKNDCERNAAKRLLPRIKEQYKHLRPIVVEDSLAANGPHVILLNSLDFRFILGVKSGDHVALFSQVDARYVRGEMEEFEGISVNKQGKKIQYGYRYTSRVYLNESHKDLLVNFLEYWEVEGEKQTVWTWITDLELAKHTVEPIMRGGRARWKVENETFNTLKNQGYHLEHNFGHGQQYLATVFGKLTFLAFLVDQLQELGCELFRRAVRSRRTKISFWNRLKTLITACCVASWEDLLNKVIQSRSTNVLVPNTS